MHQVLNEKIPYFSDDGLSCAESTLRYLIEHGYSDLPLDTVRIMTGLHGNMGRCANCGAVNGSVAAIGANFGRREVGEDMTLLYELTERFMQEFEQTFGSVKCAELMEGKDPALAENYGATPDAPPPAASPDPSKPIPLGGQTDSGQEDNGSEAPKSE